MSTPHLIFLYWFRTIAEKRMLHMAICCFNKDRPELACDGKRYLAKQIKAENDRKKPTFSYKFAQVGIDLNLTKTTLNFVYQAPLFQNLNGNQTLNGSRLSIGFIQSFKL